MPCSHFENRIKLSSFEKKSLVLKDFTILMPRSLTGVLYIVHCIGFILPKQFRTLCQVKNEKNDPNVVVLFESAGR